MPSLSAPPEPVSRDKDGICPGALFRRWPSEKTAGYLPSRTVSTSLLQPTFLLGEGEGRSGIGSELQPSRNPSISLSANQQFFI